MKIANDLINKVYFDALGIIINKYISILHEFHYNIIENTKKRLLVAYLKRPELFTEKEYDYIVDLSWENSIPPYFMGELYFMIKTDEIEQNIDMVYFMCYEVVSNLLEYKYGKVDCDDMINMIGNMLVANIKENIWVDSYPSYEHLAKRKN